MLKICKNCEEYINGGCTGTFDDSCELWFGKNIFNFKTGKYYGEYVLGDYKYF